MPPSLVAGDIPGRLRGAPGGDMTSYVGPCGSSCRLSASELGTTLFDRLPPAIAPVSGLGRNIEENTIIVVRKFVGHVYIRMTSLSWCLTSVYVTLVDRLGG